MATVQSTTTAVLPLPSPGQQLQIDNLLQLQKAAKKINSILDLEKLIDSIVNDVICSFGCIEASIFLRHESRDEVVATVCQGCKKHGKGHSLKIGQEGMVGRVALTGRMHYAPDVSRDPYYLPCEENARSALAIPLKIGDRVIGVFHAAHPEVDGFTREQLQLLHGLAEHIAIAVENARLYQRERELNERHRKEAAEAQQIQQQLLPKASLFLPNFTVSGATLPAGAVGGDWYDYIELPGGKWGFVLADVAGKGMAAALLMSATRGVLRAIAETVQSPGEVLARINRTLLRDFPAGRFITMVYGVLDPVTHTFTFANAGHPWPVVSEGLCTELIETETGLPLGITETTFSETTLTLKAGGRVLLYSDGISE
ncbi:MAG TPA: GAF domain-containing SpoIIE family protein phosphatase, partial [Terriglobales bacterium]|nr:GAF domain-containing SpoIIE family protein phosphatase [Terriglobales bacterium]